MIKRRRHSPFKAKNIVGDNNPCEHQKLQNNATHRCRCSIELTDTEEYSEVKTVHQEGRHAAIDKFG